MIPAAGEADCGALLAADGESAPIGCWASVAAAAAIGRDRSFRALDELGAIEVPVLIVPGADERHPAALAEQMSVNIPNATLAQNISFDALRTADDLADAVVPEIRRFLDH